MTFWISRYARRLSAIAFALFFAFLAVAPAGIAQGCVMCYTSASAAGKRGERALDEAILTLLIPVLALFIAIFIFAWRRGRSAQAQPFTASAAAKSDLQLSWSAHIR